MRVQFPTSRVPLSLLCCGCVVALLLAAACGGGPGTKQDSEPQEQMEPQTTDPDNGDDGDTGGGDNGGGDNGGGDNGGGDNGGGDNGGGDNGGGDNGGGDNGGGDNGGGDNGGGDNGGGDNGGGDNGGGDNGGGDNGGGDNGGGTDPADIGTPTTPEPELPVATLGSLPSSVAEGQTITATVNVSPAPDSDLTVRLHTSQLIGDVYGAVIVSAPTMVTVAANSTSASFSITTQDEPGKQDIPASSTGYHVLVTVQVEVDDATPKTYSRGTRRSVEVGVTEG